MINKLNRRGAAALALGVLMMCAVPFGAYASEDTVADDEHECSVTVDYAHNDDPISGASFDIYLAADIDEDGDLTVDPQFEEAGIALASETDDDFSEYAETLEAYILLMKSEGKEIQPVAEGVTDSEGLLKFDGLEEGLYLLVGDSCMIEDNKYIPLAAMVSLPFYEEDNEENHHPVIYPKYEIIPMSLEEEPITVSVEKIWQDSGCENARPQSIEVVLFCDGEKYDTVTLSEDNGWKHSWSSLTNTARWQLAEKDVPDGYTVTSVQDNYQFTVTNTADSVTPNEPGETPSSPDTPTVTETPQNPDTPTTTETSSTPETNTESTPDGNDSGVPDTGQAWWTVSVLSFVGLILIVAIWNVSSKSDRRNK